MGVERALELAMTWVQEACLLAVYWVGRPSPAALDTTDTECALIEAGRKRARCNSDI